MQKNKYGSKAGVSQNNIRYKEKQEKRACKMFNLYFCIFSQVAKTA